MEIAEAQGSSTLFAAEHHAFTKPRAGMTGL